MRFIVSHHPPAYFFWAALLNSLLIIWCLLVTIEAIEPPEHCEFLLRMLKNTILGNGRQNVTLQAPSIVWRYHGYGEERAKLDNE